MTDILITEVTTKALSGTGAFDTFMYSVDQHLQREHDSGRITGNDYAQVYLSALQATMQQAITFVLEKQNASAMADKTVAETGRIVEEKLLITAQTAKTTAEVGLTNAQAAKVAAETGRIGEEKLLITTQTAKTAAEIPLAAQQVLLAKAETAKVTAETAKISKEEALIDAEILKINQEILKAVEEVKLITAQTGKISSEVILLGKQGSKIDQEILRIAQEVTKVTNEANLLLQKKYTEEAQIKDTVAGSSVTGVIGKQKDLYSAQTDGFSRDAEQKMAKIMADVANVRTTTGATSTPSALVDADISKVIAKAASGIGVSIS